jgi:hypothetical protein
MPKIRQAIAVLAAAAFCIGFNTYRYPVVGEMASAISLRAQSAGANATAREAAAEKSYDGDDAATSATTKPPAGAVCKDGVCTMPLPDSPTASLSPTPFGDTTSSPSKPAEEEPARSFESAGGTESKSRLPEYGESSSTPDQTDSSPKDGAAKTESSDPPAGSAGYEAWSKPSPYSTPTHDSADESWGKKMGAKFVSTSGGSSTPEQGLEKPSTATEASLIPIVRPTPRTKSPDMAAAKAASDFKLPGEQGSRTQGVRHLPPVDSSFGDDAPSLTPELVQTYQVTSAK